VSGVAPVGSAGEGLTNTRIWRVPAATGWYGVKNRNAKLGTGCSTRSMNWMLTATVSGIAFTNRTKARGPGFVGVPEVESSAHAAPRASKATTGKNFIRIISKNLSGWLGD
jgi:hypothetical protein